MVRFVRFHRTTWNPSPKLESHLKVRSADVIGLAECGSSLSTKFIFKLSFGRILRVT